MLYREAVGELLRLVFLQVVVECPAIAGYAAPQYSGMGGEDSSHLGECFLKI